MFRVVSRYWYTLRNLRPVQIYGRVWYRLHEPSVDDRSAPNVRVREGQWVAPVARPITMLGPDEFCFLNQHGRVENATDWNNAGQTKLWLYNLHYFDDLNAVDARERNDWHRALIDRWIAENPAPFGNGWEPYPLSLRFVNWIKWALAGNELKPDWRQSLAVQVRWLERRLEWHLLGNHLLANAKALVFAGLFFDGQEAERWLAKGLDILKRELAEQILPDGGHFERSPMYHAIILEDVLDLVNIARTFSLANAPEFSSLPEIAQRMQVWLEAMSHPDGRISFFNDAAFGIAPTKTELQAYSGRLGLSPGPRSMAGLTYLRESGYVRIENGKAVAILDVAPVGPDYLPGHAHADTLSFELSIGRNRVIVNGGTSVYGTSKRRRFERSTPAHSTVEIDGQDSSEVWGGFRVARRARVKNITAEEMNGASVVSGEHNGYERLRKGLIHCRRWQMEPEHLVVTDTILGSFESAVARFHLGPGTEPIVDDGGLSGELHIPGAQPIRWRTSVPACIQPFEWHPEFGKTVSTKSLVMETTGDRLETQFSW